MRMVQVRRALERENTCRVPRLVHARPCRPLDDRPVVAVQELGEHELSPASVGLDLEVLDGCRGDRSAFGSGELDLNDYEIDS